MTKVAKYLKNVRGTICGSQVVENPETVDVEKVKAEEKQYRPIPVLSDFTDENGKDRMAEVIEANYYRIKQEAAQIVEDELRRIADDPKLKHLFKGNETVAN